MTSQNPLVSIIVVTYNSAKYVEETLESAYNQTYGNIELIISDDGSKDDTLEICNHWLKNKKHRFKNATIITTPINTGVPANCNRGVKSSAGEWIKMIAGDDLLLSDCILNGMQFVSKNAEVKIFASSAVFFTNKIYENSGNTPSDPNVFFDDKLSAKDQFDLLLHQNYIIAPTLFFTRFIFNENEGFDEKIPYMEDYPFYLKTLKNGYRINFFNQNTVGYRVHNSSISGYGEKKIFNTFYKKFYHYQKNHTFQYMNLFGKCFHHYHFITNSLFDLFNLNNKKYLTFHKIALKTNFFRFLIKKKL